MDVLFQKLRRISFALGDLTLSGAERGKGDDCASGVILDLG